MDESVKLNIICDTEAKAKTLFRIFKCKKYVWNNGSNININDTKWRDYGDHTSYFLDNGRLKYGTCDFHSDDMIKITADQYIMQNNYSGNISIWSFFKGIVLPFEERGLSDYVKEMLFNTTDYQEILDMFSEEEIGEKYEEYLIKYALNPGDVIQLSGGKTRGIVLDYSQSKYKILWRNMNVSELMENDEYEKSGHVDIEDIIEALSD